MSERWKCSLTFILWPLTKLVSLYLSAMTIKIILISNFLLHEVLYHLVLWQVKAHLVSMLIFCRKMLHNPSVFNDLHHDLFYYWITFRCFLDPRLVFVKQTVIIPVSIYVFSSKLYIQIHSLSDICALHAFFSLSLWQVWSLNEIFFQSSNCFWLKLLSDWIWFRVFFQLLWEMFAH